MVRTIVGMLCAALLAYAVGAWAGYDPRFVAVCAMSAGMVFGYALPAHDWLGAWGVALGILSLALAFVPEIPSWLEWTAEGVLGAAVAMLATLGVSWCGARAWRH